MALRLRNLRQRGRELVTAAGIIAFDLEGFLKDQEKLAPEFIQELSRLAHFELVETEDLGKKVVEDVEKSVKEQKVGDETNKTETDSTKTEETAPTEEVTEKQKKKGKKA